MFREAEVVIIVLVVVAFIALAGVSHFYYGQRKYSEGYASAQAFDRKVAAEAAKQYENRIQDAVKGRQEAESLLMLARSKPFGGLVCYKTSGGGDVLGKGPAVSADPRAGLLPDKVVGDTESPRRGTVRSD